MRAHVRVFVNGALKHEEQITIDPNVRNTFIGADPCMLEIEFLDEPDINQRFFRIGTDPRAMVVPIKLKADR